MDSFVKTMFDSAVLKEQAAQRMYKKLAEQATNKNIRELFLKLSEEETIHERLFRKMDLSIIRIVNNAPLQDLKLLKDIEKDELLSEEIKGINETLDFAIQKEQEAADDYNLIAQHLNFGEAREAFSEAAIQELRHKNLLEKVKLEFNKDDWKII